MNKNSLKLDQVDLIQSGSNLLEAQKKLKTNNLSILIYLVKERKYQNAKQSFSLHQAYIIDKVYIFKK